MWRGVRTKAYSWGCCLGLSLTHLIAKSCFESLQIISVVIGSQSGCFYVLLNQVEVDVPEVLVNILIYSLLIWINDFLNVVLSDLHLSCFYS